MQLKSLMLIKSFQKKVKYLKEAFNLTATSFGLQPIKLVIIENKDFRATCESFYESKASCRSLSFISYLYSRKYIKSILKHIIII